MLTIATMSRTLGAKWLAVDPVRAGDMARAHEAPERYVTVTEDGAPILRVDLHACHADCFAFEEAIVWRGQLVVGFGSFVHAVTLADRSVVTVALGSYFGHLYPTDEYLLLTSGERVFRMEPDRSILWRSAELGIDGVVVHEAGPPVVRGDGEWDPPGGWRPFAVRAVDGTPVP